MEGKEIKKLRKRLKGPTGKDMTQAEFGVLVGVSRTTVINWEKGTTKPCSMALRELKRVEAM